VWHLLNSVDLSDLIEGIDGGRQAAMETEDFVLNNSGQRKIVEEISVHLPNIATAVFPNTFIEETIAAVRVRER
jgi:hypothetical protein